jgi:hypothetical protein
MHILGICYIYTSSRFNSYSIKLVTLRLYNYSFLKKIIRRVEKHFIKRLNIVVLDTASTPIRISSIYALYIIGLSLNLLTTFKSVVVIYTRR